MPKVIITEGKIKQLVAMWAKYDKKAIAEKLNITTATVHRWARLYRASGGILPEKRNRVNDAISNSLKK